MIVQTISKNNKVFCTTSTPYPPEVVKQMKAAGYKVKESGKTLQEERK